MRKLESHGFIKRVWPHEMPDEIKKITEAIRKAYGHNIFGRKFAVTQVYLPEDLEKKPLRLDELMDIDLEVLNETENLNLSKDKIILEKIYLRGKPIEEKTKLASEALRRTTRFRLGRYDKYTHEQKIREIKKITERVKQLPQILNLYLAGSVAQNLDNETSDIDILIVRESCPGYEKCSRILKKVCDATLDIFCCSADEYKEAERMQEFFLYGNKLLYSRKNDFVS